MAKKARVALVLAGTLGGFLFASGQAVSGELAGSFEETSVAWSSREDFEGGGVAGSGGTIGRNIDTNSSPGDVKMRRNASSWQAAAPRVKLFDSGRMGIGLTLVANGATGEYLAAWSEFGGDSIAILVQRFSALGTPVGAAKRISSGPYFRSTPRLAEDAKRGQFLAVYLVAEGGVRLVGRLLKADGTPVGREIVMADCRSESVAHDLLWVPGSGDFLLVWSDRGVTDGDLFARRLGADGLPLGKPYLVSGRPGNQNRPRLASRRKSRDQVVVFEEESQGRVMVLARRLDAQGSPAGEEFVVSTHKHGGNMPAAVCGSGDDALLVAWDDMRWVEQAVPNGLLGWDPGLDRRTRGLGRELYARVFAGDGQAGRGEFLLAGGRYNQTHAEFAAESGEGQVLAVWQDGRRGYENWDIRATALEADGALAGEELPLGVDESAQLQPVVAYNKRQREFLAAWEDAGPAPGSPAVYGRRVAQTAGARGSIEGLRADSGSQDALWGPLSWNADLPEGAILRVSTRTAKTEGDLAWTSWSEPLDRPGLPPSTPAGRWIEIRVELESRDGKAAPVLHDIGVTFKTPRGEREPGPTPPPDARALPPPPRDP